MKRYPPFAIFVGLALVILGPALAPGNIFLLDMPWPAQFQLSDYTNNGIQPQLALHVLLDSLNLMIPAWFLQKLALVAVLAGAGSSVYALAKTMMSTRYALYAGLLAMLNPFVFERLAAGQWLVLAGYAYTPFVIYSHLKWGNTWKFWVAYAFMPIISIHFWVMFTILGVISLGFYGRSRLRGLLAPAKLYILFGAINGYWILTLLLGNNASVSLLRRSDFEAFMTLGDPTFGLVGNVIGLYGFWRPSSTLKGENGLWFVYALLIFTLAAYGLYAGLKSKKMKWLAQTNGLKLVLALFIAIGFSSLITRSIIEPFTSIPGATVLRETAKLLGIVAIIYALWAPYGLQALVKRFRLSSGIVLVVSMISVVMMSGMFFGLNGKLASYDYPEGWHDVNILAPNDSKALILPWQGYMDIGFAGNVFMANPSKVFFDFDVIQSQSTGNQLLDEREDAVKDLLDTYVNEDINYEQLRSELTRTQGVTHIVLLKTGNWNKYDVLPRMSVVFEDSSILVIEL